MTAFHPELRLARFIPTFSFGPLLVGLLGRAKPRGVDLGPDVVAEELTVPGPTGAPEVGLRILRPASPAATARPGLLWIHGGGLITGSPEQDDVANAELVRTLGIVVAAVRYRLAPAHRAPAAVEDAYAGLLGLVAHAAELGVDPGRIAVGGASAGGGLAAALALMAHDRGRVAPVFQLLVYPMLDDRTVLRTDHDTRGVRVWTPGSNRYGWTSYLGDQLGADDVSAYAAPARRADLSGLPPAWIGVGSLNLFHDEDVAYAAQLRAAGVPCTLDIVPGAFHGFNALFAKTRVSRDFQRAQAEALRAALL